MKPEFARIFAMARPDTTRVRMWIAMPAVASGGAADDRQRLFLHPGRSFAVAQARS
ncbi:hypothetical protein AB7849_01905 [Rhodanobacter sp. 115]|uniref:hypothetical protein n=1 Tax=Rhodanobacter sp. FW021-MT20 TaxID=1162282 RepID=UPI0012FAFDF7|nr:hypothetical protein [Rhodanobacter sp. 115]